MLNIFDNQPLPNVFNKPPGLSDLQEESLPGQQVELGTPEQRYSLRKRKMPMDKEEKLSNLAKAMITVSELLYNNKTELALIMAQYDLDILIPRTYKQAITNVNYG